MKAVIRKIEYYLPSKIEDGETMKLDNPEWRIEDIEKKTGILKRYISGPEETAVDLAVYAAEKIFVSGDILKVSIDCLILVTQSPDYVLPASACIIQQKLGLNKNCLGFDVNQGCSGFIVGLALASSLVESKTVKNVLLLCSETYTKYINKHDRTSRPVFSDGAAAIVIEPSDKDSIGPFDFGTDGAGAENLIVKKGGARQSILQQGNESKQLFMNGSEVFMFTMEMVPKSVSTLLATAGKRLEEVDLFIFHQASLLVLSNIQRRLQIPDHKIFNNIGDIGNTVSASIPIALKRAIDLGIAQKGQTIMLVGFGVGYSWGSCLIKYIL